MWKEGVRIALGEGVTRKMHCTFVVKLLLVLSVVNPPPRKHYQVFVKSLLLDGVEDVEVASLAL